MRIRTHWATLAACAAALLATPAAAPAQAPAAAAPATKVGDMTGNAELGHQFYQRFCVGCHGVRGDGMGENAQWIEPKPRDFTAAIFKCRSTPTGTLPTDQDLFNAVTRGFNHTYMPSWEPLTDQTRVDLVAYIKTFSPRWVAEHAGKPIDIPAETPVTKESVLHGRELFVKLECWKCHGPQGRADGPSASGLTDSKDMPIKPFNFAENTRFKCGTTNADMYRDFMTGIDGTPMPSFADNLTPADAWDLVHFLRTLQPFNTAEAQQWHQWLESVPAPKMGDTQ